MLASVLPPASQGALLPSRTSWPSPHCLHRAKTSACGPGESFYNSSVKWLNEEVSEGGLEGECLKTPVSGTLLGI